MNIMDRIRYINRSELEDVITWILYLLIATLILISIINITYRELNSVQTYKEISEDNLHLRTDVEVFNSVTTDLNVFFDTLSPTEVKESYDVLYELQKVAIPYTDYKGTDKIYYNSFIVTGITLDPLLGYTITTTSGDTIISNIEPKLKQGDTLDLYFTKQKSDGIITNYIRKVDE